MSRAAVDDDADEVSHPRRTADLFGPDVTERALLDAYRTDASARLAHRRPSRRRQGDACVSLGTLLGLHPDSSAAAVQSAQSLALDPEHPVFRRVARMRIRTCSPSNAYRRHRTMRTFIVVGRSRAPSRFSARRRARAAARLPRRSADALNPPSANKLLKVRKAAAAVGCSCCSATRQAGCCRPFVLAGAASCWSPLAQATVVRAVAATGMAQDDAKITAAAKAADGSVVARAALSALDAALRERVSRLLEHLPQVDQVNCTPSATRLREPISAARHLHGDGARVAHNPALRRRRRNRVALHGWRRHGRRSTAPPRMSNSIISSESRWFSPCRIACRHRAVDT